MIKKILLLLSLSFLSFSLLAGEAVTFPIELIGAYKYLYPYNSDDLVENHYIVIAKEKDKVVGRYYGTSDDFDDDREGYLPGFYVSDIKNLKINGSEIEFDVTISKDDLFLHNIGREVKSSSEVNSKNNPLWIHDYQPGLELSRNTIHLAGTIVDNEIHIQTNGGLRRFIKM